tara:strand:- start:975 stop:1673 length:699 start_codon:yes stop_codon:yes gene_type:complete
MSAKFPVDKKIDLERVNHNVDTVESARQVMIELTDIITDLINCMRQPNGMIKLGGFAYTDTVSSVAKQIDQQVLQNVINEACIVLQCIESTHLANGSVIGDNIKDNQITFDKLYTTAVESDGSTKSAILPSIDSFPGRYNLDENPSSQVDQYVTSGLAKEYIDDNISPTLPTSTKAVPVDDSYPEGSYLYFSRGHANVETGINLEQNQLLVGVQLDHKAGGDCYMKLYYVEL